MQAVWDIMMELQKETAKFCGILRTGFLAGRRKKI